MTGQAQEFRLLGCGTAFPPAMMFNPPTEQDEWVLMFVIQLMTLGHEGDKGVMAMLGRELYPAMQHLLPQQAALAAYVNLDRPRDRDASP